MEYVTVPPNLLPEDVLQGLMEAFIGREGTDYGEQPLALSQQLERLKRLLDTGKAVIVYQAESDSCNILLAQELARFKAAGT